MKHLSLVARIFLMLCICLSMLALAPVSNVHAATVPVTSLLDDGSAGTLRIVLQNANPGDIITFNVTGIINLVVGQLLINKNLTITGPGVSLLTINGGGAGRIFDIGAGSTVSISDMTITGGSVLTDGAGIRNSGILTLDRMLITANVATQVGSRGGGIMNQNGGVPGMGMLTINDSTISNNTAKKDGGGIYSDIGTTLTLKRDTVTGNSTSDVGGRGGGIAVYSAELTQSTLNMDDTTVSSNSAQNYGGGIAFSATIPMNGAFGTLNITDSVINQNSTYYAIAGGQGGGLYIERFVNSTIQNTTISSNTATGVGSLGGGMITYGTTVNFNNVTVASNSADLGGGVYLNSSFGTLSTLKTQNSIIGDNISTTAVPPQVPDCYASPVAGGISSLGNNLVENITACFFALITPSDITGVDPVLGTLINNGGPTKTHELKTGSPAIDVGNPLTCAVTDQRLLARPLDGDNNGTKICDMGAFERKANVIVTYLSIGTYDGWVLELNETSNTGGTKDTLSTVFILGDAAGNKQYRAILSFNTASLPPNAQIIKATLKIKKKGLTIGTDPFTILGPLVADIRKPYFGTTLGLYVNDFQAIANRSAVGTFPNAPVANWYSANIVAAAYNFINLSGPTQFRLRFSTDDNNDGAADYMKFYSGDYSIAASRPALKVEYYVP
jgi:predicted outer membrane repeat protein